YPTRRSSDLERRGVPRRDPVGHGRRRPQARGRARLASALRGARGTVRRLSPGSRAHGPSTAAVLLREGGRRRAAPLVPRPACARSSRADRAEPADVSSSVRDAGRAAGDPPRGDRVTGVSEQNTTASPTDETAAGRGPGGPLRVAVLGAAGRMGATVCAAVEGAADLELVARLDAGDEVTPQTLRGAQV